MTLSAKAFLFIQVAQREVHRLRFYRDQEWARGWEYAKQAPWYLAPFRRANCCFAWFANSCEFWLACFALAVAHAVKFTLILLLVLAGIGILGMIFAPSEPYSGSYSYTQSPNPSTDVFSSQPTPSVESCGATYAQTPYAPSYDYPSSSGSSAPPRDPPSPWAYNPRIRPEVSVGLGALAGRTLLESRRVDVSDYWRDTTHVDAYTRRPPGGFSAQDYGDAGKLAFGVTLFLHAADYAGQVYDRWQQGREDEKKEKRPYGY